MNNNNNNNSKKISLIINPFATRHSVIQVITFTIFDGLISLKNEQVLELVGQSFLKVDKISNKKSCIEAAVPFCDASWSETTQ